MPNILVTGRRALMIAAAALSLAAAGCTTADLGLTTTRTQGYVLTEDAIAQIRPGQSKELVLAVLGSPQHSQIFGEEEAYYYVQTVSEQTAFGLNITKERTVLAVYFDRNARVAERAVYGLEDGRVFNTETRRTPSFGRDSTFVESLFDSL